MKIWGISDLHLSFSTNKPMDIFGDNWADHASQMAASWDSLVQPDDVVLCPGDLSWAMKLEQAAPDLAWIGARPGLKILGRGNHDYWWSSIGKVRAALPPQCIALQNDAVDLGEVVVAGTRAWCMPGSWEFTEADQKIYDREVLRLEMSLKDAQAKAAGRPIIAAIHYPPLGYQGASSELSDLLEKYDVKLCVFGHLHGKKHHDASFKGLKNGVEYRLIACDFLKFTPTLLWPLASL